jgi:hypothetical protein
MSKLLTPFVLVALVSLLFSGSLLAHHGWGATYDMRKQLALKGTVSRVDWRNPHVMIHIDVKDADGKVVTWSLENEGVSQMAEAGCNPDTLKAGQEITAIVNPAANGSPTAVAVKVVLAEDGARR